MHFQINFQYQVQSLGWLIKIVFGPVFEGDQQHQIIHFFSEEESFEDPEKVYLTVYKDLEKYCIDKQMPPDAVHRVLYTFKVISQNNKNPTQQATVHSGTIKKEIKYGNISPLIHLKEIEQHAKQLPGVQTIVHSPCACKKAMTVFNIIIHLNDKCGWSRESIADWIDNLHDDGIINAEFEPWESDQAESTELTRG